MFRTLLISLCLTSTALANPWYVDDDGKADFDNIQAAVDAASDGDEIIVMPGTYTSTQDGHVVNMLGKAVTLRSSDPDDPEVVAATIIDGEDARRGLACFNNETTNTIISGFTVTNGYSVFFDYNGDGYIDIFEKFGGGMLNYDSSPTITECTFDGNTASYYYGGGMINYNSSPTLTNCSFTGNTASAGGGMYNYWYSNPTLENCTFTGNTAYTANSGGGGMQNDYSSPTIKNCTFANNTATYGGGMYNYWYRSSPTLINCTFTGNYASSDGGGMCNWTGNPTLTNCTFIDNTSKWSGGGIYGHTSIPTLTDTTVCGNTPDQIASWWTDNGGNTIADECPLDCPDINGDGNVDVGDLLTIIDQWGLTNSPADVNADGIVDVSDLLIVVGNWGPCE